MTDFVNYSTAIAAGYKRERRGHVEATYRGYDIVQSDISGYAAYGYRFGIKARLTDTTLDEMIKRKYPVWLGPFGHTVTLWFSQETNKLSQSGYFAPFWPPRMLEQAIEEAKRAIDAAHDDLTTT